MQGAPPLGAPFYKQRTPQLLPVKGIKISRPGFTQGSIFVSYL